MPDSKRLLILRIPADRGPAPQPPFVPDGPVIQESGGEKATVRTYQDLLEDEYDIELFEYYCTAQPALVSIEDGAAADLGEPALFRSIRPSPDGAHFLVQRVVPPYSYQVPVYLFPEQVEVWNHDGSRRRELYAQGLREEVPIGGVETGLRRPSWRPDVGAELIFVEALDGGDPQAEAEHRDRLLRLADVFDGEPREWLRVAQRFRGIDWLATANRAWITDYDRKRRWQRTLEFALEGETTKPRVIFDRSSQDRYGDPGRLVTTPNAAGFSEVLVHEGSVYLSGRGASPEGDRPFLDRLSLETLETERLWRCEGECYESFVDLLNPEASSFLTLHESPTSPPNYFRRDRTGTATPVTRFPDPFPQLRDIHKELVTYERADGVPLSATLYLPPEHREGDRHPLIVWAYPREYNSASDAGQVSGSPYRFTRMRGTSHLFLLTQGYAVMDAATMPIVGPTRGANDTFVEQLVAAAEAAVRYAAERGVAEPERAGIGGHSYGAFMTANLLAHSDLFACGVARSGAYNRTLTPFGFQNEERTFWEAPEIYFAMSPFMHADDVDEPILLIHGMIDNNSGTFPVQSERMYDAIRGHGGHVRLVMLPHESHGYGAKESVFHVLAEMVDWFDRHLGARNTPAPEGAP